MVGGRPGVRRPHIMMLLGLEPGGLGYVVTRTYGASRSTMPLYMPSSSARTLKALLATARTRRWPPWRPRSSAPEALDLMIIKPGIVNLTTKHKQRNSPRAGGATAEAIISFISRFLHAEGQRPPWCNGSTGACGAPRPGSIGLWPENPGGGPIRISTQSSTAHWEESSQSEASTGLVRWRCALEGGR